MSDQEIYKLEDELSKKDSVIDFLLMENAKLYDKIVFLSSCLISCALGAIIYYFL